MGSFTPAGDVERLLQPLKMGDLVLKNRIVMASLTRNRDNVPRENLHVPYYSERAGTGLIVSQSGAFSSQLPAFSYFYHATKLRPLPTE